MLADGDAHGARQLIGVALDVVVERLAAVELWVEALRHGDIEHRGCLVAERRGQLRRQADLGFAVHILRQPVLLVGHNPIGQPHVGIEALSQCPAHQVDVVLLQVLVDVRAWNLNEQRVLRVVVRLEDDRLEPRFVGLLLNVLPNQMKAVVPKRLMTFLHHWR